MRRPIFSSICASVLFLLGAVAILILGPKLKVNAQAQAVFKAVAAPAQVQAAGGPAEKGPKAASMEFISFPADRDAQQLLEAVQQYIQEAKADNEKWDRICEAAQRVLDIKSDSFFEIEEVTDGEKKKSRISVKVQANRLIGAFKPAGRQFYQLTYGPVAKQLLDEAIAANYDRTKLADVSQRYFHTNAGAEATLLLAGLNLDRGQYLEAAYAYERYLNRPDIKDSKDAVTPRTMFKAAIALKRAGDPANLKRAQSLWSEFAKVIPRDGLTFGNRTYNEADLKAEYDRPVQSAYARANDGFVTMRLGNPSHTAVEDGGTVFLDPTLSIPMVYLHDPKRPGGYDWVRQNLDISLKNLGKQKLAPIIPGFFPISAPGMLIFRNYSGVYCIATGEGVVAGKARKPGDVIWMSDVTNSLMNQADPLRSDMLNMSWTYYQNTVPSLLFENPLTGSLSHDGKYVYYVNDLAVPPPPTVNDPNMARMGGVVPMQSADSSSGANQPTLAAINLENGKEIWSIGSPGGANTTDEQDDAQTNPAILMQGAYFLGPPLPVNGKLYVLFEKNGKLRLACLDNERLMLVNSVDNKSTKILVPTVVWSQRIGEPKERLPNDSIRRFQCSYLAYADGVLVCGTNTGAVVGIDVMSRSLLWAHSYRTRDSQPDPNENPNVGLGRRRPAFVNGVPANAGPVSQSRWKASAPLISNGRVIVTAYDSKTINCIDLRTGNLIWYSDMDANEDLYVGNIINGKVLIVGKKKCRAYELDYSPPDPKVRKAEPTWSKLAIGMPCGHGVASKDGLYYLPVSKSTESDQPQILGIDPVKGEIVSKSTFRRKLSASTEDAVPLGNLIFHDGQVFTQTPKEVLAFPLIELKRKMMDDLLRANPKDPAGLLSRGELKFDEEKWKDAITDLKASLAGNPSETVRQRAREKLYFAYTELLRSDFSAGKAFLDEYKSLLEVPIDTEDPAERQKLIDEQLRRQSTFLSLWAKGKEKEGDLVEAFHYYREFAKLGDNKSNIPIEGEPFGQIRPDIWARGRIEGMIRNAASAEKRKPLEALVEAEWNTVKSGTDVNQLREFVRIFGPYFPAGKEAQLSLAEKLLASNSEENVKEAEGYLSQLMAAEGRDALSGRAAELLARNLMQQHLYEDAVAMYSQIGTRFESTVIRDGKTGADFLASILTDRRLLPYLEPARIRSITRAKVEMKNEMRNGNFASSFQVEPEGELMPFFRRFRLSIEVKTTNFQSWTLSVNDRASGALRCKFDNLAMPMLYNHQPNFSWSDVKIAQANGHLLLLHCGTMVYCLDLAEKKMLWQYNLIAGQGALNIRSQTTSTDGEMTTMFEDGWLVRLSRSSLLRDGFAALLTRDGLVMIDSFTGQKLWQLNSVNPRSILFGDNRYLLVADPGDGKPTSKVIRVADGTTVEGIANFAPLVTGPGRLKLIGRNILVYDKQKDKSIRLHDPIEGKDIWTRPVEEKTFVVNGFDSSNVALLGPSGKLEMIEPSTGKVLFKASLDAEKYKAVLAKLSTPTILADADRYYLVLNHSNKQGPTVTSYYYGSSVRSLAVQGPIICFDRSSGEQLWATDKQFENQHLVTDRFADLPVLLATMNAYDQVNNRQMCEVIALDKQTGKIKLRNPNLPPNGQFMELKQNKGAFELSRYDTKIVITPLENGKE
ncbi:MAG: PQQ-binding-like beta-propeller repeat protein [Gemmataceae bacterium]